MKGDILVIDENHHWVAKQITDLLLDKIQNYNGIFVMSVAGESGAGKSEIAASIAEKLEVQNFKGYVFCQDDYFKLPPKTNALQRKKDIGWVGTNEVRLDLLDQNIAEIAGGKTLITKPLVNFNENKIVEEAVDLLTCKVLIAEGTYTSLLKNVNCRIFIDRNKFDTIESRQKRAREKQDEFLERILTIEHEIISQHKKMADIIVSKEWNAFNT